MKKLSFLAILSSIFSVLLSVNADYMRIGLSKSPETTISTKTLLNKINTKLIRTGFENKNDMKIVNDRGIYEELGENFQ